MASVTPIEAHSLVKIIELLLKIEHTVHAQQQWLMSTHSCAVCVTIFSNSSIIQTGFKFTELHALTLAARSYALLVKLNAQKL